MPRACCVPGCRSNYRGETYTNVTSFPKDPERRKKWEGLIDRKDFNVTDSTVICLKHFEERFIERNLEAERADGTLLIIARKSPILTENAFPSIFPKLLSHLSTPRKRTTVLEKRLDEKQRSTEANISGPYSSGSKLKSADPNQPSTSSQEEVLPDVGVFRGLPDGSLPSTNSAYDPNIIIKQEIFETELDPSTYAVYPPESQLEETITPNAPENTLSSSVTYNELSECILPDAKSHSEVTAPITSVDSKVLESSSTVPIKRSKRYKKSGFRKVYVKKNGKRSPPNPSESSSEEDEGGRRPRDKFDAYAEFIASKLRDMDPRSCAFVQTAIADLIFEAELGRFLSDGDKSIFTAKTQELLKNMPPACENEA